eukprot:SAG11_NODE_68_length_18649_cov_29.058005_1_plen_99_part_10
MLDLLFAHKMKGMCTSPDYSIVRSQFQTEVTKCEVQMVQAIEDGYERLALQRCPHLILLSNRYYAEKLRPILVRWLSLWLEMKSSPGNSPEDWPTAVLE